MPNRSPTVPEQTHLCPRWKQKPWLPHSIRSIDDRPRILLSESGSPLFKGLTISRHDGRPRPCFHGGNRAATSPTPPANQPPHRRQSKNAPRRPLRFSAISGLQKATAPPYPAAPARPPARLPAACGERKPARASSRQPGRNTPATHGKPKRPPPPRILTFFLRSPKDLEWKPRPHR